MQGLFAYKITAIQLLGEVNAVHKGELSFAGNIICDLLWEN